MHAELKTELDKAVIKAADEASVEIGEIRRQGKFVCDISYIIGAIKEATINFCEKHGLDPRKI